MADGFDTHVCPSMCLLVTASLLFVKFLWTESTHNNRPGSNVVVRFGGAQSFFPRQVWSRCMFDACECEDQERFIKPNVWSVGMLRPSRMTCCWKVLVAEDGVDANLRLFSVPQDRAKVLQ
eukprot:751897-Hanusia_phi.AAC.5